MSVQDEQIDVLRSFRRLIGTDEHNLALFDATLQSVSDRLQGTEPVGEVLRVEDGVARVAMYDSTLKPGALIYAEPTCAGTASQLQRNEEVTSGDIHATTV